jgi:hypothetical protein
MQSMERFAKSQNRKTIVSMEELSIDHLFGDHLFGFFLGYTMCDEAIEVC